MDFVSYTTLQLFSKGFIVVIIVLCTWVSCLHVCLCVSSFGTEVTDGCGRCWELKPDTLEVKPVLLSIEPCTLFSCWLISLER